MIFAPEEDAINVTFTVLDDDIVEAPEDVQLVLMPRDGERGVFFPAAMGAVSGVIQDDNDSESIKHFIFTSVLSSRRFRFSSSAQIRHVTFFPPQLYLCSCKRMCL